MARYLSSRSLIRSPAAFTSFCPAFLPSLDSSHLLAVRCRSNIPADVNIVEIDLDADGAPGSSEIETLRRRRIVDDAIHGMIVRHFAPDWLPFVPGRSYWVPLQKRPYRVTELIASLADAKLKDPKPRNLLSKEEKMSLTTERGWPSSAYFFGSPSPQVKSPQKSAKAQTDDEDN
ncbi:uncharacterized protein LOC122017534 [Zingiber officinale]|uniref:Uncharacterized protein n=1 Tax=Zingiber officinale TaxID=94328 RepID=A0A8J5KIY5_ZINOF|nr:uncharacterized protein LOC122017534 [Zingiber officinale]KAG6481427.1 hypothetical protein ZIOFF_058028 [Zingiber officinale]